jgi:uncharacterized protein (TIGR00251 family)
MAYTRIVQGRLFLDVKVQPGAARSEAAGLQGDRLRLRIAAAPEDGKANEELRSFLAKALGCGKKDIRLQSGEKSRLKTLELPLGLREKVESLALEEGG